MTATTTAPRPTRTGATSTPEARTRKAQTTSSRTGRRNTTDATRPTEPTEPTKTTEPTETTETTEAGIGPAAGSDHRVHAALTAGGDLTVAALAEATGLGRSTVSKALTRIEAAGQAVRTTIGTSGRARQPDRWNPTTTATPAATAPSTAAAPSTPDGTLQTQTPQAQASQTPPETDVESGSGTAAATGKGQQSTPARKSRSRRPSTHDTPTTTSSPSSSSTDVPASSPTPTGPDVPAEGRMNPMTGTARLAPGALTQLVADHFGRHPGVPLTSGEVGRALGRSGGAVRNAADKLLGDGALRLLDGAPRRYTTTD